MLTKRELPFLPSIFYASDIERTLICRILDNFHLLSKSFHINTLSRMLESVGIGKRDQGALLQSLLRLGVIYSLEPSASKEYIDSEAEYFLHAERIVQALINHSPEQVIGKLLFKFENEGIMLDGGFINHETEIFDALMERLTSYYGLKDGKEPYLPNFIRIYECIGLADGRDFYTKERRAYSSITTVETHPAEKVFYIPKYLIITKEQSPNDCPIDQQRICVCIN